MTTTGTQVSRSRPGTVLPTPPALPWAEAAPLERDELTRAVDRLVVAYPAVGPGTVLAVLVRLYRRFDHCRVRTYVPVLVERAAREELDGARAGRAGTSSIAAALRGGRRGWAAARAEP